MPLAERTARTFDLAPALLLLLDGQGRIVGFNRACEQLTGYLAQDVVGRMPFDFLLDPLDLPRARGAWEQLLAGQVVHDFEIDLIRADGARRRVLWHWALEPAAGEGAEALVIGCGIDISGRRTAELRLRESEERYALAVRGANDGLWDWNITADCLYCSPRWHAIVGNEDAPALGRFAGWLEHVHPEDRPRFDEAIDHHLHGRTPHVELEMRMRHSSGLWRWVLVRGLAIRNAANEPYRMAGSLTDVTERKAIEEQLVRGALLDSLTGAANRVLLENRLEHALARSRRNEQFQFALLFLDLDRFKIINDGLGHLVGDQLLVEFSRRLASCIRASDTLARLGGDEFVILLEDLPDATGAPRVAQRIHELLARPFLLGEHEVFTTASIGIAPGSPRYRCAADILRDADAAMYRAKAMGKARSELFDQALHERAIETLRLENDLRRAIERREFVLHYQPILSLEDLSITGFEALVRWRHPDRGLVAPAVFIPVLEETGLIVPLGNWVLEEATRQMAHWRTKFLRLAGAAVSINVSGKQIARTDLAALAEAALQSSGLSHDGLILEITESVMMTNADSAGEGLARLREAGVRFHIDDFGMGYSSLSLLHRFPIDGLKIDRSFVSRIGNSPSNPDDCSGKPDQDREAEIVRTILALARNLEIHAVAEGVETVLQMTRLRSLGCQFAQGYLFAKPLPAEEIELLMANPLPWASARLAG